ncbi:hypothetical protein ON064_09375 [Planococcus sp. A6]|uniref:hypothetical protein n=1 Tax=Planococcus sp. A6 TaxID=2992760 RepID=UPI00237C072F|nr:hypothetical protein [Planococcus sp. A6]MDE0583246.1 hypothetical protein [Planococcus sp. A6]
MINILKWGGFISILFLAGCNQESNELTKEELETIYREEVQKELEKGNEVEKTKEIEEEDSTNNELEVLSDSSPQNKESNREKFESLPMDTQVALLAPYYDERGGPQSISEGLGSILYGMEESFIFIQVHSGAGVGHPVYRIERQVDTFYPVDGVLNMGISGYEVTEPPQVSVTIDEIMADYENNPALYDASAANTDADQFDLASFNQMKVLAEETSSGFEIENDPEIIESSPYAMFVDGILYSGETLEEMSSAEELRAQGYEIHELTTEEFDKLKRDIDEFGVTNENLLDYYLSNY